MRVISAIAALLMATAVAVGAEQPPSPGQAVPDAARPVVIHIEAIDVVARVVGAPIVRGVMGPPPDSGLVGWYADLGGLGQGGNVVMSGYYDDERGAAVFYHLDLLGQGDVVEVSAGDGSVWVYRVEWVRVYEKASAPLGDIVGPTPAESLTLITDAPPFDIAGGGYERSTVVRAALVEVRPAPATPSDPVAAPAVRGEIPVGMDGAEDAAVRTFGATGFRLVGPLLLEFQATRFDRAEKAAAAMQPMADRFLAGVSGDVSGVRPASVRPLGDERLAIAGTVETASDVEGPDSFVLAILAVREGEIVHFMVGVGFAGDPLADLADVAEKVVGRQPGGAETPVAADGMREGGLWDVLPRLADLPEGFVLDEERVPPPFAPLPGQGTPAAG